MLGRGLYYSAKLIIECWASYLAFLKSKRQVKIRKVAI